jgi:hypothetical protein
MRAILGSSARAFVAIGVVCGAAGCGDVATQGRSPAILVIDGIEAAWGVAPGNLSGFLLSDVQTIVEQQIDGETVRVPTIFNDVGEATFRIILKDQGTGGQGVSPSRLNAVTLNRYRVVYKRADGLKQEGKDVPYAFDGAVSATITEGPTTVGFEIVRHQAKLDAPLRSLANFGGRLFISTLADITFYGSDLAGNEIQATGTISVSFSDYADPE